MNIIIPIGGIGQRFREDGYVTPKPLINVLGEPMICHLIGGLNVNEEDTIGIVYNQDLKLYNFEDLIRFKFPDRNIKFVSLDRMTKGASETILFGLDFLDLPMEDNFLVLDCDTFYEDDIIEKYRECSNKNTIFYFNDDQELPIFSYIKIKGERVTDIMEKVKISNNANTGAYGFSDGNTLRKYCQKIENKNGELYVSLLYKEMIEDGIPIISRKIENFRCVGTPLQLKVYCESNRSKNPKRFCFDLDNTIVTYPKIPGDYTSVEPIKKTVEYLKFLKSQGHYIIIHTARRMKTHKGNIGGIIADVGKITLDTLEKFNIPYDEILFGKPHADFYIDDLAVNAFHQIDKILGFIDSKNEPRGFNDIQYKENRVIKKTNNPGELYWYKNFPSALSDLFPRIISINESDNTIEMDRVEGVNCSYLYVNGGLKEKDIELIIKSLRRIHESKVPDLDGIDLYGNYSKKMEKRYLDNLSVYQKISESDHIFNILKERLKAYEDSKKAKAGVIHGDPVFTNIFLVENGIKYIDPRGKIEDDLTLFGDVYYDFAKVYQSVLGYDLILNDIDFDFEYQEKIKEEFESNFLDEELQIIKDITASLLFTLMPLHSFSEYRFNRYIKLIKKILYTSPI